MKDRYILAFETSCDETSVAVLKNDDQLLSNIIASQIESHKRFGGVVPEVASRHHVEVITACIEEALEEKNLGKEIDIEFTSQYVQLTLNGAILFDSGKVDIKEEALPLMNQLGIILQRFATGTIEIEGHTDNVPMSGSKYANNDELSSGRALSVFYYLEQNTTLDMSRVKHSGRGEYVPIADNSTEEGRSRNRRVEIKIYNSLSSYE